MYGVKVLSEEHYQKAFDIFKEQELFFPLIGSVLEKNQGGIVLSNSDSKPDVFYVIHKFGFSFYYGEIENSKFNNIIIEYLIKSKDVFLPKKLRWYNPPEVCRKILKNVDQAEELERIQLRNYTNKSIVTKDNISVENFQYNNIKQINNRFPLELFSRFWNGEQDFMNNSFGVAIKIDNRFASVCYAAGISNHIVEIDVYTKDDFRKMSLGKIAVNAFVNECKKRNVVPNWDCFSNNISSCNLAKAAGFDMISKYPFFTLFRDYGEIR